MNYKLVLRVVGRVMVLEAVAILLPMVVALLYCCLIR